MQCRLISRDAWSGIRPALQLMQCRLISRDARSGSRPTLQLMQCRLISRDARSGIRRPIEQRLGPDGKLYTVDKFSALFGRDQWESAQEERRRDTDGVAYTFAQFEDFYGSDSGGVPYVRHRALR